MAAGATPLDADEAAGLLPGHITSREQLDEWESENILEGERWARSTARRRDTLDDAFLRELHRRMFGRTWKWAGSYRATEKNIGIAPPRIAEEVRKLLDDTRARLAAKVAPLLTNLLLEANDAKPFSWGRDDLEHAGEARDRYLTALRAADARDFAPLLAFVRGAAHGG